MTDIITPSIILLSASPRSGKSTTIRYLMHKLGKAGRFQTGLCFSGTAWNAESASFDYLPEKAVGPYSTEKLKTLLRAQKRRVEEGKPRDAFLILDDVLGSINFNTPLWTTLVSQYRHFRLTILLATQYIYRVPPTVRACATYVFIYRPSEGRSMKALWETYGSHMRYDEWQRMVHANTRDYHAIMCDTFAAPESKFVTTRSPLVGRFKLEF